ncbi:hypothetical protein ACJIZ3_023923 [Penstemon smallii]|uniref:Uncharacterized protein n=1 Tax=Penstemon smallii TaxID=265156 RepID=A0ABD3TSQ1_9LAMI
MALMKKIFIHITEFQNWINDVPVGFRVVDDLYRIRDLPPGKTQQVKVDPIIRCCKRNEYEWNIGVFLDGNFTGLEISPLDVIVYARLIFRHENKDGTNVLVVEGIREENSDYLLRLKFFGFMRNMYWDKRPSVVIARSDSKLATKLRMMEAHYPNQKMDIFAGIPLPERQTESPLKEGYQHWEKAVKENGEKGKTKTTDRTIKKEKIVLPPQPPPPEKPPRQRSTSVVNRGASANANISPKRVYERNQSSSTTSEFTDVPHAPPTFRIVTNSIITNSMDSFDHAILFVLAMTLVVLVSVSFG